MNISISASQEAPKEYIVDSDLIKETERAIGLPVGHRGEYHAVSCIWFPKHYIQMKDLGSRRMRVTIPAWLVAKKRTTGELLSGFDIITTF